MSKKEKFIETVETLFRKNDMITFCGSEEYYNDVITYFTALKGSADKEKPAFTETGKEVLKYMQDNREINNNLFNAKGIAAGLDKASRSVAGSMKKLITDGYVEKLGENPCSYSLTEKGLEMDLTN